MFWAFWIGAAVAGAALFLRSAGTFELALAHVPRRSRAYKCIKFVLRLLSGQCEIERLCLRAATGKEKRADRAVVAAVELAIAFSSARGMSAVRRALMTADFHTDEVLDAICAAKGIRGPARAAIEAPLRDCLARVRNANIARASIRALARTAYDSANAEHEGLLEELWGLLRPDVRRNGGRFTSEWGEIGFQGKDPATDFRGMGILGLLNLIYFAKMDSKQARSICSDPVLPFAITGINLTSFCLSLLDERTLSVYFYHENAEGSLRAFHEIYCRAFVRLYARWQEARPVNVMAFGEIFKAFQAGVGAQVAAGDPLGPQGASGLLPRLRSGADVPTP
eukprot:tig00001600_g9390.t1